MTNFSDCIFKRISFVLQQFEQSFQDDIQKISPVPYLNKALSYATASGGKRIRPYIILEIGLMLGVAKEKLLPVAVAIEMIHSYSLIHDDLPAMDNDDLRRGRPTVHRQFDQATAILAGDGLLTEAFNVLASADILSENQRLKLIKLLALTAGGCGMVGGQMLDIKAEDNKNMNLDQISHMQNLKTGEIFRFCFQAPILLIDVGQSNQEAMLKITRKIAADFGALFQITDDLIGFRGDSSISGKPNDSDSRNGKTTLVSQQGVVAAQKHCEQLSAQILNHLKIINLDHEAFKDFIQWLSVREK